MIFELAQANEDELAAVIANQGDTVVVTENEFRALEAQRVSESLVTAMLRRALEPYQGDPLLRRVYGDAPIGKAIDDMKHRALRTFAQSVIERG